MTKDMGLVGRLIWISFGLAAALVVTGLQMDRQTVRDAGLAYKVPVVARAYALQFLAQDAYANNDVDQGLAYSRDLVRRRPIPAEHFALLAYGLFKSGHDDRGTAALILSAKRGWRAPFTQVAMVNMALQANDPQTAAQRILGLWRAGTLMPVTKDLTGQLLRTPGGLEALTSGMAEHDRWGTTLLIWALWSKIPTSQLEALSQAVAGHRMTVSCPTLSLPLRKLARTGGAQSVRHVWDALCAGPAALATSDSAFNDEAAQGPFDWRYPDQAGLAREIVRSDGTSRIVFVSDEVRRVILATRTMALDPGVHIFRMAGGQGADNLTVSVDCFDANSNRRTVFAGGPVVGLVKFTLPPACPGQEITLLAYKGQGSVEAIKFE